PNSMGGVRFWSQFYSNEDMTKTLRISQPEELLGYLPHHLGFYPVESLVALGVRGPRQRLGLVMRMDIDDLTDVISDSTTGPMLREHMEDDGAEEVVLVAYTDTVVD